MTSPRLGTLSTAADWPRRRAVLGRGASALGLGALTPLAFAPLQLAPMLLIGFGGLFLLLDRTPTRRGAFLIGWLFGLGSFFVGLYWITEAFAVDAERFGALALPALLGLSAFLAMFPALSAAAARLLAGRGNVVALAMALVACWALGEWIRGTVLTGFPWNIAGYAWGFAEAPLQGASLVGIHGLGVLALSVAVLPALALRERRLWPLVTAAAIIAALWTFGSARLSAEEPADATGIRLRLVQPNVPQSLKWAEAEREATLRRLIALSRTPGDPPPTHVIWPETAVPYLVAEEPAIRAAMATAVPPDGALLTGAVRRTIDMEGRATLRNSIVVLDAAGTIVAAYDKVRLVPFGEYQPFRRLFDRLPKLTVGDVDFVPGAARDTLAAPGLPPAWPLICYEAIFPEGLRTEGLLPSWILTVTNDAWFGTSWGPYQHLLAARLRAIELGLPLIRVANSGISVVTNALGRERARLPLGVQGILDIAMPGPLPVETYYVQFGELPFAFAVLALGGGALAGRRRA